MHHPIDKPYVYRREGGRCYHCHKPLAMHKTTLDHYLPRSKGGTYDVFNLVASCKRCNHHKESQIPVDVDAVHLGLFKQAVSDKKIVAPRFATYSQLCLMAEEADRVVHKGSETYFETPHYRLTVNSNKITNISQLKRVKKEQDSNCPT